MLYLVSMKSIRIAVYVAIVIGFARKILAKVSKPSRTETRYYYDNPRGLADAIAIALGVPKDRFRLIGGETPDSVQVAFKDKNIADEIAKRMWQSIPTLGDQNAVKAYTDSSIKVYRDTLC